tara:strand:+ start:413 stop:1075 length:663 start_codon:yes stop_codon:yes gene_type:complete
MNLLTPLFDVYKLSIYTFLVSLILDLTICLPTTKKYMKNNTQLYIDNLHANLKNLFILSPFYYFLAYNILLDNSIQKFSILNTCVLLFIQNIFYHYAHQYMHIIPNIRWIHDFHHKYTETTPTIGNAVTMSEFQIAYILPFLIGSFIVNPSPLDLKTAIFIISTLNMFIHSQELKEIKYFDYLVSPKKHIGHHETRSGTYSAPLLDLDKLINNYLKSSYK